MANVKFTELAAVTTLATGDILPVVVDPGSLPVNKKITYGDFFKVPPGRFEERKGSDVASANDMTLGSGGNFFKITGTTTINGIATADWIAGSQICLWFADVLTVTHDGTPGGGFAPILLPHSEDLITEADTILGLVFDGSDWQTTFLKSPT